MPAPAICIAAPNLMPSLVRRLTGEGEVLTFADTEPILALQAIIDHRPRLIVLERLFAATPRGAALINRIKTDPYLSHVEVRVMSHTGDYARQVVKPSVVRQASTPAAVAGGGGSPAQLPDAPDEQPRPADWHGTRRAQRHRLRPGVEIQLDGTSAAVVDCSIIGAQVLSPTILRPNQKVRVSISGDDAVTRFRGAIAWAKFELPKTTSAPCYRAGVEFLDADAAALHEFCAKNRDLT